MKSLKGLLIKFVIITAALLLVLGAYGVSMSKILLVSIVLTGISFIVDLLALPKIKNIGVTAIDFGLAFIVIWGMGALLFQQSIPVVTVSAISAIIIAFVEFPFHLYMMEQVISIKHAKSHTTLDHQGRQDMLTEFGAEINIERPAEKVEKVNDK